MADDIRINISTNAKTATKDFDDMGDSVLRQVRKVQSLDRGFKILDKAFNSGKINGQQYAKGIQQLNTQLNTLATGHTRATKRVSELGAASQRETRKISGTGMAIQQVGYQTGDFLVQIQGGTNAMVAFGQQATQLVGILPMVASSLGLTMGAAIGISAALGIIIPLVTAVGAYFMRSSDKAETLEDAIKKVDDALGSMGDRVSDIEDLNRAVKNLDLTFSNMNFGQAVAGLGESLDKAFGDSNVKALTGWQEFQKNFLRGIEIPLKIIAPTHDWNLYSTPEEALTAMGLDPAIVGTAFFDGFSKSVSALDVSAAEAQLESLVLLVDAMGLALDDSNPALASLLGNMEALVDKTREVVAENEKAKKRLEDLQEVMELLPGLSDEQRKSVTEVVDELGRAKAEMLILSGADITQPLSDAFLDAVKLSDELGVALDVAVKIGAADAETGIIAAGIAASNLARELGVAYNVLLNMQGLISRERTGIQTSADQGSPFDPRSPQYKSKDAALERTREIMETDLTVSTVIKTKKAKGGGGGKDKKTPDDAVKKLQEQLDLQRELIGKSEEYIVVRNALGDSYSKIEPAQIANLQAQVVAIEAMKQAEADRKAIVDTLADSMGAGLTAIVDGTKSVKDAFKDMARAVIAELWKVYVVQKLVAGVKKYFAAADGAVISGGAPDKKFANGGVVGGPTTFPMAGGKTGLMGEAGPEAIMPLKRGKNGKLGVAAEGGGSQTIVVNQSFNFQANGDESVKKIIAQAAPSISAMAQKGMMDQRRRGGAMKSTFG